MKIAGISFHHVVAYVAGWLANFVSRGREIINKLYVST